VFWGIGPPALFAVNPLLQIAKKMQLVPYAINHVTE
jgi:hypothetical protein